MADETTPTTEPATQEVSTKPQGDGTDWKAEARKWESRAKADLERYADYDDLKAKAAQLDQLMEDRKSAIERANDAKAKAEADAADWKSKYEAMQAESERMATVAQMAAQYKVDAGTLTRMSGDVEDNARYLAGLEAARPKFGDVHDGGEQHHTQTLDEALSGVKSTAERIRIREQWAAEHGNDR